MKVLQVHNGYRSRGGEDVVVEREAEILRRGGHDVTRFTVTNPDDDIAAGRLLLLAPWNPSSRASLEEVVEAEKPDVAHVHNTWFSLSPSVIEGFAAKGVPVVMTLHNYRLMCLNGLLLRDDAPCRLCVGRSPLNGVRYRCYRDSLPASAIAGLTLTLNRWKDTWDAVSLFLANSRFAKETYMSAGFAPDKLEVKQNFTTDPGMRTVPVENSDVVLFVGRISPEKGVDFLSRLWASLDSEGLRLRVVGDGPLRDRMQRTHQGIEFTGSLDASRVAEEMLGARALLFPSLAFESCPLVVLEAFASGLPVMASDRGAMTDLAAPLGRDWLRTAADDDDWREGLRLIHDPEAVASAGRRARMAYEAEYTPEIALKRLEEAYARVTN